MYILSHLLIAILSINPDTTLICNDTLSINYFRASGELGGRNEGFQFTNHDGIYKGAFYIFNKKNAIIPQDTASIIHFYYSNDRDYKVMKVWQLDKDQISYLKELIKYFKTVNLSKDLYSNAAEHYYIKSCNETVIVLDKGRELMKHIEMKKIFRTE